jgi:hypothetical protein
MDLPLCPLPGFASGSSHDTLMSYAEHPPARSATCTGERLYVLFYPSRWSWVSFNSLLAPHETV